MAGEGLDAPPALPAPSPQIFENLGWKPPPPAAYPAPVEERAPAANPPAVRRRLGGSDSEEKTPGNKDPRADPERENEEKESSAGVVPTGDPAENRKGDTKTKGKEEEQLEFGAECEETKLAQNSEKSGVALFLDGGKGPYCVPAHSDSSKGLGKGKGSADADHAQMRKLSAKVLSEPEQAAVAPEYLVDQRLAEQIKGKQFPGPRHARTSDAEAHAALLKRRLYFIEKARAEAAAALAAGLPAQHQQAHAAEAAASHINAAQLAHMHAAQQAQAHLLPGFPPAPPGMENLRPLAAGHVLPLGAMGLGAGAHFSTLDPVVHHAQTAQLAQKAYAYLQKHLPHVPF